MAKLTPELVNSLGIRAKRSLAEGKDVPVDPEILLMVLSKLVRCQQSGHVLDPIRVAQCGKCPKDNRLCDVRGHIGVKADTRTCLRCNKVVSE